MQPLAQIAHAFDEFALDECVHILIGTVNERRRLAPAPFENVVQRSRHFLRLRVLEDTDSGERVDPCEAARHVIFEEPLVEAKGRPNWNASGSGSPLKRPDQRLAIGYFATGAAERSTLFAARRRALFAAVSTGSPQILMKPSAAA